MRRTGVCLALVACLLGAPILAGCWADCYELRFEARSSVPTLGAIRVPVTAADEKAHGALRWIAGEVSKDKTTGGRRGRWLVDDFWAFAKERGVDPSGVPVLVFMIRGTPVSITPIDHCL
jgi:hypothetical protein